MRNLIFVLAAPLLASQAMAAAPYPAKPIKIFIPIPVGSGTDAGAVKTAGSQPE